MIEQTTKDFIETLFRPNEIIDLRYVESWNDKVTGKSAGQLKSNDFITPEQLIAGWDQCCKYAEGVDANNFFGIAPRLGEKGAAFNIPRLRCLWADIDRKSTRLNSVT